MTQALRLLATAPGCENVVLDELRAELEAQHGALFQEAIWQGMTVAQRETWLAEVLDLLRTEAPNRTVS